MENVHFKTEDYQKMEKQYRINFINSLTGFKSGNFIGTISSEGKTNLAIFTSALHFGVNLPFIGLLFRPLSVRRHTYENIKAKKYYTMNHIHKSFFKKAHQTSARYAEEISEFEAVQLTPEFS